MRYIFILFLFIYPLAHSFPPVHKIGNICHAENANANYGGLWELSLKGNLVCNYWQFLGDESRKQIEAQLDEYGEFFIQHTQNDDEYDGYWEVDDLEQTDWNTEPEEGQETIIE